MTVTYKTVDTCAAEFAARTPYHYSTWEDEDEVAPLERPAVVILGSGPNRIGQGIEFDYCCVHAAFELSAAGFETVMVNCNPETVSTDYDTSDRLFFEPLTPEDVLHVCGALSANLRGVIVSLGGQTPLKLAHDLEAAGIPVLGTSPESIDLAEDRERFNALCERLGIPQPPGGVATEVERARGGGQPGRVPGARPAVLRARRTGHGDRLRRSRPAGGHGRAGRLGRRAAPAAASPPAGPSSSTGSWRTPPRSTSTRCATPAAKSSSAGSWSTSKKPACTPATPPAPSRRPPCPATSWPPSKATPGRWPTPSTSSVSSTCSTP